MKKLPNDIVVGRGRQQRADSRRTEAMHRQRPGCTWLFVPDASHQSLASWVCCRYRHRWRHSVQTARHADTDSVKSFIRLTRTTVLNYSKTTRKRTVYPRFGFTSEAFIRTDFRCRSSVCKSFYIPTTGTGSQSRWMLPMWSWNVDKQYVSWLFRVIKHRCRHRDKQDTLMDLAFCEHMAQHARTPFLISRLSFPLPYPSSHSPDQPFTFISSHYLLYHKTPSKLS